MFAVKLILLWFLIIFETKPTSCYMDDSGNFDKAMHSLWGGMKTSGGLFSTAFWAIVDYFKHNDPPHVKAHYPSFYTSERSRIVGKYGEASIAPPDRTPDFRIEEAMLEPSNRYFTEHNRPYRMSPHYKQLLAHNWYKEDKLDLLACYCTTAFKRYKLLAGCAILTRRHILTTATSTELILRKRKHMGNLNNILGGWYESRQNVWNASLYFTPCRIDYHPKYVFPMNVNRTHPFPVMYDLSIWAITAPLPISYWWGGAIICQRGGSPFKLHVSVSTPNPGELAHVIGYQFMKAYGRVPVPWFKYFIRTIEHIYPCPKGEWGWYHCYAGDWAPLGLESGAALHLTLRDVGYRYDGLLGLNVVSMKLRSLQLVHYFIVVDCHPVLDFMYDSYNQRMEYQWLDNRFKVVLNRAPAVKKRMTINSWYKVSEEPEDIEFQRLAVS